MQHKIKQNIKKFTWQTSGLAKLDRQLVGVTELTAMAYNYYNFAGMGESRKSVCACHTFNHNVCISNT